MLSARLFDALDFIGRAVRGNTAVPFGGIRVVLTGDFAQLPPVAQDRYCFESSRWSSAIGRTIHLKTVMRQVDPLLIAALNELRLGRVSAHTLALFNARVGQDVGEAADGIVPTKLYARRKDVSKENAQVPVTLVWLRRPSHAPNQCQMLRKLPAIHGKLYQSQDAGQTALLQECAAPAELRLKCGAQVVLVRTLMEGASAVAVNGSRGVVADFDASHWPIVRFLNGASRVVQPVTWTVTQGGREVASRKQVPLALAWALTIHKAQGMTIDRVQVDLTGVFDYGQSFVALSRCATLEGLSMTVSFPIPAPAMPDTTLQRPLEAASVRAHPAVVTFYETLAKMGTGPVVAWRVLIVGKLRMHSKHELTSLVEANGGSVIEQGHDATHCVLGDEPKAQVKKASFHGALASLRANVVRWSEEELMQAIRAVGGRTASVATAARVRTPPPVIQLD